MVDLVGGGGSAVAGSRRRPLKYVQVPVGLPRGANSLRYSRRFGRGRRAGLSEVMLVQRGRHRTNRHDRGGRRERFRLVRLPLL